MFKIRWWQLSEPGRGRNGRFAVLMREERITDWRRNFQKEGEKGRIQYGERRGPGIERITIFGTSQGGNIFAAQRAWPRGIGLQRSDSYLPWSQRPTSAKYNLPSDHTRSNRIWAPQHAGSLVLANVLGTLH